MPRSSSFCRHLDIRQFDGVRTCLSCGVAIYESLPEDIEITSDSRGVSQSIWSYNYRKLNLDLGQEIRLVVLQPGEIWESIRCEIIHVHLEDDPEYAAVSYTWANENGYDLKSRRIYCLSGTSIPVTENCEAALRRLRSPALKQRLWIDAICINQNNIHERNHQVGLMDRIYSKASKVCICIHDPKSEHRLAMSWLKGTEEGPNADQTLLESVRSLLSLRWFGRVWVIQEVALARAAFLYVNKQSVFLSPEVLGRLRSYCRSHDLQVPGPLRWSPGSGEVHDLIICLDAAKDCFSIDPRDRIYAILSLVEPSFRKLIPIDYSQDLDWINIIVFVAAARHYKNLDILSQLASASTASEPSSWIPDLKLLAVTREPIEQLTQALTVSFPGRVRWLPHVTVAISDERFTGLYSETAERNASATMQILPPKVSSRSGSPRLLVRSHPLATITASKSLSSTIKCVEICERMSSVLSILQHYDQMLNLFRDIQRKDSQDRTTACHRSLEKLLREVGPNCEPIPQLEFGRSRNRLPTPDPGDDAGPDPETSGVRPLTDHNLHDLASFIRDGLKWGEGRQIFQTDCTIGFTHGNYREGDQVYVIDGAKAPFILRSVGENQYKIVSDCYLWAALSLDYWQSGTVNQAHESQTRMIELV